MSITLKASLVKDIIREDAPEEYGLVDKTPWRQDGKYQSCQIIFEFNKKYYVIDLTRSGSPFTDWYYSYEDWEDNEDIICPEVEEVQITKTIWRIKKEK